MKLVVFSDLHLDSAFVWLGSSSQIARRRRQALRETLQRILALAEDVRADAILCGGDLYEQERFTPDTAAFLQAVFAQADPVRVFIAPGNHDWYGPKSLWRETVWPSNVYLFTEDRLTRVSLADGLTLWGAAHRAPANTPGFLDRFRINEGGIHLALFHGSERGWLTAQGEGKVPHAPFDAEQIERAGLHHVFLGHYHTPRAAARHTYPGNPDPLSFGESGTRGPVVATIAGDGSVDRQWHSAAVTVAHDFTIDVTGCTSQQQIRDRIKAATSGSTGIARITLNGELRPDVDLRVQDLSDAAANLDAVSLRVGNLRPGYDLESIGREATVRGQFVRDVLEGQLSEDERRRVLVTGLRALDRRSDLEVV